MVYTLRLSLLLQGLTLCVLGPACGASSLGLTVHVVPLDSSGGQTVRAHFSAIAPSPCPSLSGLCATGEDCLVHTTQLPFIGTKPAPGWCVRQWQKTVPSDYNGTISLGDNADMYVKLETGPKIRANSGKLNQPPYVALLPPLRARVNCPHHYYLSTKDLDGDKVRCRFARSNQLECVNCTQHSFIELDEEKCQLVFTGEAPAGQYFIYLMAEDFIPIPKISHVTDNKALSSVPVHLSLTVEESNTLCSDEPIAAGETPKEDSTLFILPYQEQKFRIHYTSQAESAVEAAVVGPPELYRVGFKAVGPLAMMSMAWVRSENNLTRLLPICFAINTKSLQSEPRCVWLYQREMRTLPAGTELKCENTDMTLILPISTLTEINLDELQLNSPTCPVFYNSTHLTATISLSGCGTKTVHSGSELVYTNTLKSVRPYSMVSRQPSFVLPLACRIPAVQAKGPQYKIGMPTEKETFGEISFSIEFYLPGEGPLSRFTKVATLRSLRLPPVSNPRLRREAGSPSARNGTSDNNSTTSSNNNATSTNRPNTDSTGISSYTSSAPSSANSPASTISTTAATTTTTLAIGSRINLLDLHVFSNCSLDRAEIIVSSCIESETEDFAVSYPILDQGCTTSESTLEVITSQTNTKVYRLDLSNVGTQGSTMYVRCIVNLCIATMPSDQCPDLCSRSFSERALVGSVYTSAYTITSNAVSLVVTTPAPVTKAVTIPVTTAAATTTTTTAATTTTTTAAATTTTTVATTAQATTTSHAPEKAPAMAFGMILTTICIFIQNVFLH